MKLSFNGLVFPAILLLLLAAGCSSSSKKQDDNMAAAPSSDLNLELNADSDSGRAGPIQTVFFDFNSSTLTGETQSALDSNVTFLKENPSVEVQVEGHCDERGGIQFNLALGENRANSVVEYMISSGISPNRLSKISFGKERPAAFGHTEESWSKNRRGNFVITAK